VAPSAPFIAPTSSDTAREDRRFLERRHRFPVCLHQRWPVDARLRQMSDLRVRIGSLIVVPRIVARLVQLPPMARSPLG
jgi:hypothetical protein